MYEMVKGGEKKRGMSMAKCLGCSRELNGEKMIIGHCVDCFTRKAGWYKVERGDDEKHN
jgi:hypothetical protein